MKLAVAGNVTVSDGVSESEKVVVIVPVKEGDAVFVKLFLVEVFEEVGSLVSVGLTEFVRLGSAVGVPREDETEGSAVTTRLRVGVRLKVVVNVFVGDRSLLAVDEAVNVTVCDGSDEERDVRDLVSVLLLLLVTVFDDVDVKVSVWVCW